MNTNPSKILELLLGSSGVIISLFFSVVLLFTIKKQPKASVFLLIYLFAFTLRIGKSVFHNYTEVSPIIRTYFLITLFCIGPALWLFTKYQTRSLTKIYIPDLYHFIPFVFFLFVGWSLKNDGTSQLFVWFYNGTIIHMFIYVTVALFWFKGNQKKKYSIKKLSWINGFLLSNLFIITFYALISEQIVGDYISLGILFSISIFFLAIWALKVPEIFLKPLEKYKSSKLNETSVLTIFQKLDDLMKNDKPYLNPKLKVSDLSSLLNIHSKVLSQSVNQVKGYNVSQYISDYRIEEAKRLLVSESHKNFSIAAIAYDSGFNTLSSFNDTFKKKVQMTPIAFRKQKSTIPKS